jgi:uncharacterized membrane protein YgcG
MCDAGLFTGLARACEQIAALLIQQQQQQQQLEQQASPVLAKLLSPTTAHHLLNVWCNLTRFAPLSAQGFSVILGSAELLPTVEPACKLAAAAARYATSPAAAPPSSGSSSNSSRNRSSGGGSSSTWSPEVTPAELMGKVMATAAQVSCAVNNEMPNFSASVSDVLQAVSAGLRR